MKIKRETNDLTSVGTSAGTSKESCFHRGTDLPEKLAVDQRSLEDAAKQAHPLPFSGGTPEDWPRLAAQAHFNSAEFSILIGHSPWQARRICQKLLRRSLQRWLDEQRLLTALHLLERGNSVKSVSFELGFKQQSHFARRFKALFGVPPSTIGGVSDWLMRSNNRGRRR